MNITTWPKGDNVEPTHCSFIEYFPPRETALPQLHYVPV